MMQDVLGIGFALVGSRCSLMLEEAQIVSMYGSSSLAIKFSAYN